MSTLGGAVAVAEHLPAPFSHELLRVAREAFAESFALTAWISAAIAIATAIAAAVLLRHVTGGSGDVIDDATTGDRADVKGPA